MKIAIQGHPTRGKEVIQILESLGGRNTFNYNGNYIRTAYFIGMDYSIYGFCTDSPKVGFKVYTLEEFEKEFPFKIGDLCIYQSEHNGDIIVKILRMTILDNDIVYEVGHKDTDKTYSGIYRKRNTLKPYKEMNTKNVTITLDKAKEWYKKGGELKEIALQAFTEEELTKVDLPKTWEEFYNQYEFKHVLDNCLYAVSNNFSMKYVNKFEAFVKLQYLRDCWRQGWEPKWNAKCKYAIKNLQGKITVLGCSNVVTFLVFPTREIAEEFLKCFRDLIEKAKDLI